jgi:hypothetical protein
MLVAIDLAREVWHLAGSVGERKGPRAILDMKAGDVRGECSKHTVLSKESSLERPENRAIPK